MFFVTLNIKLPFKKNQDQTKRKYKSNDTKFSIQSILSSERDTSVSGITA